MRAALSALENRAFIVFHPAFGYFADEYGLTMYALEDEGKEATPRRLMEMVDFARESGIRVIFYQAETDVSQAQAFAEEIGGTCVALDPLAAEYTENLYEYTPMQIKQALTGWGKADKKQIQQMVKFLLHLEAIPRPDDAADGIAAAITHIQAGAAKSQFKMK